MHDSVREFVTRAVKDYGLEGRVLEVGSLDVNGTIRDLFGPEYIGIDFTDGLGVDLVVEPGLAYYRALGPRCCDVVVSTEALEHDPRPWETLHGIAYVLRGHLVLTCRGFDQDRAYGPHDYTGDYWRFSPDAIALMCADAGLEVLECGPDPQAPGVFCVARR